MKVITTNPILSSDNFVPSDWYSNANGAVRKARRRQRQAQRQSQGTFGQRAGQGIRNVAQSGLLESIATLAGGGRATAPSVDMPPVDFTPPPPPKQGLSTGAKVAIGVGVVAVLGLGIYFVTKK